MNFSFVLVPVCHSPPPLPALASTTVHTSAVNFAASWFDIELHDPHLYRLHTVRTKLHFPTWLYTDNNNTEYVDRVVNYTRGSSLESDLLAIYYPLMNGSVVNYTCPRGYVFNGTNDVTVEAVCVDSTWSYEFDESLSCVRESF